MSIADFIHLRVHSAYSLSEGAIRVKDLVKLCVKQAMPAVALTDSGNLFGALEFSQGCADAGVQPILGVQLHLRREDEATGFGAGRDALRRPEPDQVVLLAQNESGWGNLLALVSQAYLDTAPGEKPQVSIEALEGRAGGLIALTGGTAGPIGRLLLEGQAAKARALLERLGRAYSGRLYVELQRHGLESEQRIEPALLDLAYALDLPLVATNDAFFPGEDMYEAHDALLCIAEGRTVAESERRRVTAEHRFKSAAEMRVLFADLPDALDNTLVIARRCAFMAEARKPILPPFPDLAGSEEEAVRSRAAEGLERRLEKHVYSAEMDDAAREQTAKPYRERMDYELGVITKMGFSGYFLIVADFISWAKRQGIPVGPGRGSGAASVVAWSLLITDLDPLRWGLLFERFLNPERISMPDFDIDFCMDRRDEVIRYVQNRYGADRVAQIITFGKLQARAALRDVGRVLAMPYGQVDRICKLVPNNPAKPVTLPEAIQKEPQLAAMRDADETVAKLFDIATKLEGLYRNASTHAAGVVIGDRPLSELVPLYRDPRASMPATQYNMKFVESAGLVKFDFLGLKTLTVLHHAVDFVRGSEGKEIDLAAIPLDDAATYAMLAKGDTVGVFQLESTGMRDVARGMRADAFADIIAIVALFRPGPMDNIPHYIAVKHGREQADYLHPRLEWILKETYGIMIYQEQVLQIAQELSGYSLGAADILRRAMGKKNQAEMDAQRKMFVDGAVARNVDGHKASEIFDQVTKFAGYGFNKAHAAAYALVSYQTAWLKTHHPAAFLAASMTCELDNPPKLEQFRRELDRLGIRLLPPDINRSDAGFSVERLEDGALAVRYALAALKNVGAAAMTELVAERDKGGRFRDAADFARRLDGRQVNRRQLENLIRAGAFDSLDKNRARLFDSIDAILAQAASAADERSSGQASLFGAPGGASAPLALANRADWKPHERLQQEFEAIGFHLSAHPLDVYATSLRRLAVIPYAQLPGHLAAGGKSRVRLAGIVSAQRERVSQRGTRYAFVSASDTSGMFEMTLFAEVLAASRERLGAGGPLLFTVEARIEEDQLRLSCQKVESLEAEAAAAAAGIRVMLADQSPLPVLRELVGKEKKGKGRIILVARTETSEVEAWLPGGYALSADLLGTLRVTPGVTELQEL